MIYNIIELVRKNNFKEAELEFINRSLRDDQLPYLLLKYPQSEEAEVNMSLSKMITEVDNFNDNNNDFLWRSGIKFTYDEDRNYNGEIMKFLNYIIQLPETMVESGKEREKKTLSESFIEDMEEIFKKI